MIAGAPTADQWPDSHDTPVYCHPVHSIAVLAEPDVIAFDLAIALETFGRVRLASGEPGYRVRVCGWRPVLAAGPIGIPPGFGLGQVRGAHPNNRPGRNDVSTE